MSWIPVPDDNAAGKSSVDSIETLLVPRSHDLGGFEVRRALPSSRRQMVGPFIFFDQFGPAEFLTGKGVDIRAHPHIGLATISYILLGEFRHADSLGTDQMIYPGEVNWMIAGSGITHSERTSEETRKRKHELYGIQTWVALPERDEDIDAAFEHHGKDTLPYFEDGGVAARLVIGSAFGEKAPVKTFSEMFYLDIVMEPGKGVPLPDDHEDRGAYILEGDISIGGVSHEAGQMMVFRPGDAVTVKAGERGARLIVVGGETLNEPRYIWWNFVSSSRDKIEAAKEAWTKGDWANGPFKLPPTDDKEFIPLA